MECVEFLFPNEFLIIGTDVLWENGVCRTFGWTEGEKESWLKLEFRCEFVGEVFAKGICWDIDLDGVDEFFAWCGIVLVWIAPEIDIEEIIGTCQREMRCESIREM